MDIAEFNSIIYDADSLVKSIIQHQRVAADVHSALDRSLLFPVEQDDIYGDHYKLVPAQAQTTFIDGVAITTRILHQTGIGLRDIAGADLIYEIEGVKYALIQYKRADKKLSVKKDEGQLEQMLQNCPSVCIYKRNPPTHVPVRINGYCGCWYRVKFSGQEKYVHACEAKFIHGRTKTVSANKFRHGLSKSEFESLFASCKIGALIQIHRAERYIPQLLERQHVIFQVTQRGSWSE